MGTFLDSCQRLLAWMGPNQDKETAMSPTKSLPEKKDILARLGQGEVIIGDGSYVITLEKRGYVKAGDWTPEASVEDPEGVKELAKEFARAGADVTQTFTFYSTDDWVGTFEEDEAPRLTCKHNKPIAATMAIGPKGDRHGVSAGECAVRMAKAGADIVGTNCLFDPWIGLETLKKMKVALEAFNLSPYLMTQPNGYRCPDCGAFGWLSLPEFPYAIEPRQMTRFEVRQWARQAYDMGIRYIGGCCGFEPYLIRAIAEELREERKGLPYSSRKSDEVSLSVWKNIEGRQERHKGKGSREYWDELVPCTGRVLSSALCRQPDPQIVSSSALK